MGSLRFCGSYVFVVDFSSPIAHDDTLPTYALGGCPHNVAADLPIFKMHFESFK